MIIVTDTIPCLVGNLTFNRISLQDAVQLLDRTVFESDFKTVYKKDLYSRLLRQKFTKTEYKSHSNMHYLYIKDTPYIGRESLDLVDDLFPYDKVKVFIINFKRFKD